MNDFYAMQIANAMTQLNQTLTNILVVLQQINETIANSAQRH